MKLLGTALLVCALVSPAAAFEDEPDEINWDSLGGGTVGFEHFRAYCEARPEFLAKLVSLGPTAETGDAQAVIDELTELPMGHPAVSGSKSYPVTIPKDGYYRIWTEYAHEEGTHASFALELRSSEPKIEDSYYRVYDFAEYMRREEKPPTRAQLPSGDIWEAGEMVYLTRGEKTLTISAVIHEGPYAARKVKKIVITEDPAFLPDRAAVDEDAIRELWAYRPLVRAGTIERRKLWREWRKAFLDDLREGRLKEIDAARMAYTVYYDEETNLVGTPAEVAKEKARMKEFFATLDRTSFIRKIEGEDFMPGIPGWEIEYIVGTSGGKIIRSSYGGWECDATASFELPSNGTYSVWVRYMETGEHLAPFRFTVETAADEVIAEKTLLDNNANGHPYGGWVWERIDVDFKVTNAKIRLYKSVPGKAYRRVDAFIVTDRRDYVPEGEGIVIAPFDGTKPLTVWRLNDIWYGYTRFSAPKEGEGLEPHSIELRADEVQSLQLLVRNNTKSMLEATPEIIGDDNNILGWRVVANIQNGSGDWCAMPLFEREDLFVPGEETMGVWLTVDGRKAGFADDEITVDIAGERFILKVKRLEPLGADAKIPLVLGWSSPFRTVSCWEMYRDIGINVISETHVPKAEAAKYGIKLNVRFNDTNVEPDHVREVVANYKALGYDYDDWAWSFMDEPPADAVDKWLECAWAMKEIDPEVKIWVNPGEGSIEYPPACLNMVDYVDMYCPAIQHFATDGWRNPVYNDIIHRQDPEVTFDVLMTYTTPCFAEKAPSAPADLVGMGSCAADLKLDGWGFFALSYGFTYCNSVWDERNAYYGDQCMEIYPGAACRTLSTRNAEAIREAVRIYRNQ